MVEPATAEKKPKARAGAKPKDKDASRPSKKPTRMPSEDDAAQTGSAAQQLKEGAAKFARQANEKARDYAEEGKARAGGALDEAARMMGEAADTVDARLGPQYGKYARAAAEGIADFSDNLKGKELEDLMADAQQFVRKSPAVAIGIAAALGFVLARLVKSGIDIADGPDEA